MSQHDTLTLREALRSIQYEAASLADAQVIALQALNATYPARAALSATQPAQAAQSVPGVNKAVQLIPGMTKEQFAYVHHCALEVDAVKAETARLLAENAALKAQAAQGAGEVGEYLANVDEFGGVRWFGCPPPHGTKLYTQPASGADVLDAERYRWLRAQDNEDFAFAVVKNPHFDVYESPEELDAVIDAAIAASGRQE